MIKASAADYQKLLLSLLPPGQINREADSNFAKLLQPVANELARIDARARDLIREADPRTTIDLFTEWEEFAGLPDPCAPGDLTMGERRDRLIQKLKDKGGQSRPYFIGIAEELGYTVTITEFRPMGCGNWGCGANVVNDAYGQYLIGPQTPGNNYQYYWIVTVHGTKYTRFACGRSACGDPLLRIRTAEDLECILSRVKPAQTNLTFIYEEE